MPSGIYQITNQKNGNRYVGSAVNLKRRWRVHLSDLRRGQHKNEHLQRAYDKYGEGAFGFSVLENVEDAFQLIPREQHYLDTLKPEYNIAPTAGSQLGYRHTEEVRRNMSEAQSGERCYWYGKHLSEETKRKISEAKKGKTLSAVTRARIGEARKGRYHSEETRKKISKARRGYPVSAETRKKISAALSGKHLSAETRAKMSEAQKARRRHERRMTMSGIIRVSKSKDNPFVMINNLTLRDSSLTWEARGVIAYLLSKPDDWQVRMADLIRQGPGGRQRMQRILRELETAGYVERRRLRNGDGKFHWETIVHERPTIGGKPVDGSATYGSPVDGPAVDGKPVHIRKTDLKKTDLTNNDPTNTDKALAHAKTVRVSTKSSAHNVIKKHLEEHFTEVTKLKLPPANTAKQKKARAVRWWNPLRTIAENCDWNEAEAKDLITQAVREMRDLNISAPQSILKNVLSLRAKQARDGPGISAAEMKRMIDMYPI